MPAAGLKLLQNSLQKRKYVAFWSFLTKRTSYLCIPEHENTTFGPILHTNTDLHPLLLLLLFLFRKEITRWNMMSQKNKELYRHFPGVHKYPAFLLDSLHFPCKTLKISENWAILGLLLGLLQGFTGATTSNNLAFIYAPKSTYLFLCGQIYCK